MKKCANGNSSGKGNNTRGSPRPTQNSEVCWDRQIYGKYKRQIYFVLVSSRYSTFFQVWWYIPVIPALGRLAKEDHEFEASLGYIAGHNLKIQEK
jgi:hypothetical protein